jgi:hypothetical protein
MAESRQRILGRRALGGQHPQTPDQLITWLEETVAGWNAAPTPFTCFTWHGKRSERRQRARARRHQRLGAAPPAPGRRWRHLFLSLFNCQMTH